MALDVGFKKIGVALSDPLNLTAYPYKVIYRKSNRETFKELLKIIEEKEVKEVVIGLPLDKEGKKSLMAEKIEKFSGKFKSFLKEVGKEVKVVFRDESFTTEEAKELLRSLGRKREELDDVAAAILLREYLEEATRGS
ncbi:Holliday junction resolvase RuvX [Thermovibrio sp.]